VLISEAFAVAVNCCLLRPQKTDKLGGRNDEVRRTSCRSQSGFDRRYSLAHFCNRWRHSLFELVYVQDVVITGIGIICPLGLGREAVWSAIERQESGIRRIQRLAEANYSRPIGGEVLDFEPKQYVKPRKSLKVMCRETHLGFTAAELAWDDARLADGSTDPERLGVVVGANVFRSELSDLIELYQAASVNGEFSFDRWGEAMREMYPLWMLKYLPNMTCCHIGIAHDARGPINSIIQGNVSSLLAIIEASDVIARGHADVMIAGGASSMLQPVDLAWHGGVDLSQNTSNPAAAVRPFEASRDGSVTSEGAAMFILESRTHAEQRGAGIQADVLGFGRRCESCAATQKPTGQSIRQAIEGALEMSQLSADQIGHVSAHGLATVHDDKIEAQAIEQVLGDVPVTATKSYFGNLGAASGAAELAVSLLGLRQQTVPATLNYDEPDPACPVNVVSSPQVSRAPAVMALSHKLTGQATSLLVRAE
jgi:3-oxoacyl-[acyl-carrier-protein] synthase II